VRFLAMTMFEQARRCSFGLTKTFFSRSSKSAFSRHDNVRASSALFVWLNENVLSSAICSLPSVATGRFWKVILNTTCLYSEGSTEPRSLFADSQSVSLIVLGFICFFAIVSFYHLSF